MLGAVRIIGLGGCAAVALALAACCPIPLKRQVSVRPELTLAVTHRDGSPAAGAEVTVRRITNGPPPARETHRWSATTSAGGVLRLDAIEERETTMPLMMHGVEFYAWEVCAELNGEVAGIEHSGRTPVEPPVTRRLVLGPASDGCGWERLPAPP